MDTWIGSFSTWLRQLSEQTDVSASVTLAVIVSIGLVIWGNAIVVGSESLRARKGAQAGEVLTLVAHAGTAGMTLIAALSTGFSARDLGLATPRFDRPHAVVRVGFVVIVLGVIALIVFGLARHRGEAGRLWQLEVSRLLIGTAGGEEFLFRGFLLATWAAAGASNSVILGANVVAFGLWHAAGARKRDGFRWGQVVGPGIFAVVFVAARLALDSLLLPWLLHAAINLPGLALDLKKPALGNFSTQRRIV